MKVCGCPAVHASASAPALPIVHRLWDREVVVSVSPCRQSKMSGSQVTVNWDASTCTAPDYHLVWYDLSALATYDIAEETCGVGSSGSWTGLPPGGLVGVIAVGLDSASATEGSHGVSSAGVERPSTASTCAATKATSGTCIP